MVYYVYNNKNKNNDVMALSKNSQLHLDPGRRVRDNDN